MLRFRLSTTLLLAATCSLMKAEKATTCGSNWNVQHLSCDDGVISVQTALYGRADNVTCSEGRPPAQLANTNCSQAGTVDVLKKRCDGKRECELNIHVFCTSDPCKRTYKYLETTYTCLPAIHLDACEGSLAQLQCGNIYFYILHLWWIDVINIITFSMHQTSKSSLHCCLLHLANCTTCSSFCLTDQGQVIFVYGADYGRRDQTTCIYQRPPKAIQNIYCSRPTGKVADSCNGKNSCTIAASNSVFGDPCVGTYKYLEVAYTCDCKYLKGPFGCSLWDSHKKNSQRR
uniref:SUEL-type lectin domain-containing protein n=1 Tax=Sander lucioperca TaxID=283035 RepID=A0A8C9XAB8_SANLU